MTNFITSREPNKTTKYHSNGAFTGQTILGGEYYEVEQDDTEREPEWIRAYQDGVTFETDEE